LKSLFFSGLLLCASLFLSGCPKLTPSTAPEKIQFQRGVEALQKGEREQAIASFETALRLNPGSPAPYWALSQLAAEQNQLERAIQLLRSLQKVVPSEPYVQSRLAELESLSGHFLTAGALARKAVQREPKDALAQVQLAQVYEETEQLPEALAALRRAQELTPESELVRLTLTRLLARTGAVAEAWKTLEGLPTEPQQKAQYHYVTGWLLSEYGKNVPGKPEPEAALRELDEALAARPEYPAALQQKAHALLLLRRDAEAKTLIDRATQRGGITLALLKDRLVLEEHQRGAHGTALRQQVSQRASEEKELAQLRRRYLETPTGIDSISLLQLAKLEALQGSVSEAQQLVMEVLKKDPNNISALQLAERFMIPGNKSTPPRVR
jgi:tetratricopeptide (TPR) repeat protein